MAKPQTKRPPRRLTRRAPPRHGISDTLFDMGKWASVVGSMTRPIAGNTPMARAMPMPARIALAVGSYVAGFKPAEHPRRVGGALQAAKRVGRGPGRPVAYNPLSAARWNRPPSGAAIAGAGRVVRVPVSREDSREQNLKGETQGGLRRPQSLGQRIRGGRPAPARFDTDPSDNMFVPWARLDPSQVEDRRRTPYLGAVVLGKNSGGRFRTPGADERIRAQRRSVGGRSRTKIR